MGDDFRFLSGYKTYIVSAVIVLVNVYYGVQNGTLLDPANLQAILEGVGLGTLRAGVSKVLG